MIQPWEYGSIPTTLGGTMSTGVDEILGCRPLRPETVTFAAVFRDRVAVGAERRGIAAVSGLRRPPSIFSARALKQDRAVSAPPPTNFLFVGGTIIRKGIDFLLQAYLHAFSAADDVCLVIKDIGTQTVYKGQNWKR